MGQTLVPEFQIAGEDLTATRARWLLMACLMKFGSFLAAKAPDHLTADERAATRKAVVAYHEIFAIH